MSTRTRIYTEESELRRQINFTETMKRRTEEKFLAKMAEYDEHISELSAELDKLTK